MVKTDFSYPERRYFMLSMILCFIISFFSINQLSAQALACNDNVQVSLNMNCAADITPGMILEGEDESQLPNYYVTIGGVSGTTVTSPGVYSVSVTDNVSGNYCWGMITVEDKLAPIISACLCPTGNSDPACEFLCTDLAGLLDGSLIVPTPVVTENCGSYTSAYSDQIVDGGCGEKIIYRDWLFTDDAGNQSSGCTQEFRTLAVDLMDIVPPVSPIVLPCGADVSMPAIVAYFTPIVGAAAAAGYGYPTVNGVAINGSVCNLISTKTDVVIPICNPSCSNSFKVLRNWVVIDWCTSQSDSYTQIIKSIDEEAPTIEAHDITVSTSPWVCEATFYLPKPDILHDNCTSYVTYEVTGPAGVTIVWNAQVNLYLVSDLPKGNHTFNYIASDCCNNKATDPIIVSVKDKTPPIPIAKQNIVITLTTSNNGDGYAKMFAESVDNGSHDGCTGVKLEIRRDSDACGVTGNTTYNNDGHTFDSNNDTDQGKFVKFCCNDVTNSVIDVDGDGINDQGYVMVWLRVWDDGDMNGIYGSSGDNFNETWAYVKVEDKLIPVITCPPNISVNCDVDTEDLSIVGEASASSSCGSAAVQYTDIITNLNSCNVGFIKRRWSLVGAPAVFCDQTITKTANNNFNGVINWPSDYTTDCTDLDDEVVPTWSNPGCSLVGYSLESDTFLFEDGACFKIHNFWTVIDWCQYNPNSSSNTGMWNHTQIIKVLDNVAPVLSCPNQMIAVSDHNDVDNDGDKCEVKSLMLTNSADDNGDCASKWLKWTVLIDLWGDGTYDYEYSSNLPTFDSNFNDTNGNTIPDVYLAPTASGEEVKVTLPIDIPGSMSNHKILWKVSDGCQNITSCENTFMVVDKKAPTPYCIDLSTALMDDGMVELWACDFDLGSFDNCTSDEKLRYTFTETSPENDPNFSVNQGCSSRIFDCDDAAASPISVTMYVWDEKGNYDFCEILLSLIDNQGGCDNGAGMKISGDVKSVSGEKVEEVQIKLIAPSIELTKLDMTSETGIYTFVNNPDNFAYQITASKEGNHMNGVSTLDLVMIQRHILGINPFETAYQVIAGDINNDEKISASDLLQLRKGILGIINEFPENESYRFIDNKQTFTDINDPWPLHEDITIGDLSSDMLDQNFISVKIGDVNNTASYGSKPAASPTTRNSVFTNVLLDNQNVISGESFVLPIYASQAQKWAGFQASITLDGVNNLTVLPGALNIEKGNYNEDGDNLKLSWNAPLEVEIDKDEILFILEGTAIQSGEIYNMLKINMDTELSSELYDDQLNISELRIEKRNLGEDYTFSLEQNEPNPFEDRTLINFELDQASNVQITISDMGGKQVMSIVQWKQAGRHSIQINATDFGQSGVYFYTLAAGEQSATKKMIFIK